MKQPTHGGEAARCPATHIAVQGASLPAGVGLGGPRVKRCGVGQGGPIKPLFGATASECLQQSFGSQVILFATALHGCRVSVRLVFVWNGHCALSHTHCSSVINSVSGCGAGRVTGHPLWGGAGWSHQTPFRCLQQSFGSQVILLATALHGNRVSV